MLRLVFILLLLANGGYYAWSQGALRSFGLGPTTQSEPQRLAEQIHPERLVLLGPVPAVTDAVPGAPASTTTSAATTTPTPATQTPTTTTTTTTTPTKSAEVAPTDVRSSEPSPTASPADVSGGSAGAQPEDAASAAPVDRSAPTPSSPGASSASPSSGEAGMTGDGQPSASLIARSGAPATGSTAPTSTSTSAATLPSLPTAPVPTADATPGAARTSGRCLEAGPFNDAEAAVVKQRAATLLPPHSWSMVSATFSGRWMVYMGRYSNAETLEKKRAELRARQVEFAVPGDAALQPGLSLGLSSSQQSADSALADLAQEHGIRTARVVQVRPPQSGHSLRLQAVDATMKPALEALAPALAGHTLTKCE
jgi:hypothetical protein